MKNNSKIIFTIITVLWICFIFYNSIANGDVSTEQSNFVRDVFKTVGFGDVSTHFVRKMAHFIEYFVLGALLVKTVWEYKHYILRVITVPLFFGLFTAVCDETIQLFSAGRSGQVIDILLDFSGVLVGMLITGLILKK